MSETFDVVSQALALPVAARADLAHKLIMSLERDREPEQEILEDVLVARQQRVQSGTHKTYDADETLDRIKRSLDERSPS